MRTIGRFSGSIAVSTLAGSHSGCADGKGAAACFHSPAGIAVDADENLYVADFNNHRIRKITAEGIVSSFAGSVRGFADSAGTAAEFDSPNDVAIDAAGNVYVADTGNQQIRKITPDGAVTTVKCSLCRDAKSTKLVPLLYSPASMTVDAAGNVYVADMVNHQIGKITPEGVTTILAGGERGYADGAEALFSVPAGLAMDAAGNLYVADAGNYKVRKILPSGIVTTLAGSTFGYADGKGAAAQFDGPFSVAVDAAGNVYVADCSNHCIRWITPLGVVSTLAGTGARGYANGKGTEALFNTPVGVAVNAAGTTIYVADSGNHCIRKICIN
ncbi:hypothetical protein FACS189430_10700 [Bacteroidia bacterium]|nr:hypothetical protein FACS189430_10700 [Bacteroidia bacterium]